MKAEKKYVILVLLHSLLGLLIYFNEDLAKIYFFSFVIYFIIRIVMADENNKDIEVLIACAYAVGAEVLMRTTRGGISYEASKYLVILFILMGIFFRGISGKSYPYFLYLLLLVPSIFIASTTLSFDANFRTNIAFVLSGPVCLGVAALFCYDRKMSFVQISTVLLYMLLPIIAHTTYIYFYVPSLKDVLLTAASNRSAAGGFGPNQVSAILGLGMLVSGIRLFTKSPNLFLKLFNLFIFGTITFRAITTLSRGGVITALASLVFFVFYFNWKTTSKKKRDALNVTILLLFGFAITWSLGVKESGGITSLRYANKDHLGREKQSITTGRSELFYKELDGFLRSPFFGIGSSRAKDQRIELTGQETTSHSEFSRTLAEHGALGVIILIILVFKPFDMRLKNPRNYYFYPFLVFWFLTINHMSMRLAMPAFIYALALLNIKNEKRPLRRQLPNRARA